jgi:hypothetical protein
MIIQNWLYIQKSSILISKTINVCEPNPVDYFLFLVPIQIPERSRVLRLEAMAELHP